MMPSVNVFPGCRGQRLRVSQGSGAAFWTHVHEALAKAGAPGPPPDPAVRPGKGSHNTPSNTLFISDHHPLHYSRIILVIELKQTLSPDFSPSTKESLIATPRGSGKSLALTFLVITSLWLHSRWSSNMSWLLWSRRLKQILLYILKAPINKIQ